MRLRNLLEEAKDAVHNDPEVSRADRIDVIGQLDQALGEVDLVHAEDGLAIFAAPGEHQDSRRGCHQTGSAPPHGRGHRAIVPGRWSIRPQHPSRRSAK